MRALRNIKAVAMNTYREAVREKLLYTLLMFAGLMIASSIVLVKIHLGYDERIYYDVGLAAIALFGSLIAIFVGINLVYREINSKTIYTMLAKPMRRWEFLIGKYLGLVGLLALEIVLMSALFLAVVWFQKGTFPAELLYAIVLIFVELVLLTAIAIFFSSFTTPYLAGMFTVSLWIIGHLLADIREFGNLPDSEAIRPLTEALYWGLPNLDRLDIKGLAADGIPITLKDLWMNIAYGLSYASLLLFSATQLFRVRDFR